MPATRSSKQDIIVIRFLPGTVTAGRLRQIKADLKSLLQGKAIAAKKVEGTAKIHIKKTVETSKSGTKTTTDVTVEAAGKT